MRYTVVIEAGERNFSAYIPDLPGCVATGRTADEARQNIREAAALHLQGMKEDGEPVPPPSTIADSIELEAA